MSARLENLDNSTLDPSTESSLLPRHYHLPSIILSNPQLLLRVYQNPTHTQPHNTHLRTTPRPALCLFSSCVLIAGRYWSNLLDHTVIPQSTGFGLEAGLGSEETREGIDGAGPATITHIASPRSRHQILLMVFDRGFPQHS